MNKTQKSPHPIDQFVGGRVRQQRMFVGMSQEQLGEKLGLTFQQIQKYEKGANRVSASRLWEMSKIFDVPICSFFEGTEINHDEHLQNSVGFSESKQSKLNGGSDSERLRLNRYFVQITEPSLRRAVIDLAKSIAGTNASSNTNA